jgi:hypothetical protein
LVKISCKTQEGLEVESQLINLFILVFGLTPQSQLNKHHQFVLNRPSMFQRFLQSEYLADRLPYFKKKVTVLSIEGT